MWPWSEITKLKRHIEWLEERDTHRLFVSELRENMALKAYRDLIAANRGIRRLKARLEKYEPKQKGQP
jgi:hypothetical protein